MTNVLKCLQKDTHSFAGNRGILCFLLGKTEITQSPTVCVETAEASLKATIARLEEKLGKLEQFCGAHVLIGHKASIW